MLKRSGTILVVLLLVAGGAVRAEKEDGGYAGSFLQVPIGARPAGMGGAFISLSDDGAGPLYNPAGVANLKKRLFTSSYRAMKLDRTLAYVSLILPAKGNSVLGISWLYAGSGSVETRNSLGQLTGSEISLNNHDFGILFAKRFEDYLAAGLKVNYYHSDFTEISTGSAGIDVGLMFYFDQLFDREVREEMSVRNLQLGLVVRNIGARLVWNNGNFMRRYRGVNVPASEQVDNIPTEFGIGGSAGFLDRNLTVAVDLLKDSKSSARLHAGAEYTFERRFALRSGFSDGSFTAGAGYLIHIGNQALAIDYAFSMDKVDEGDEHIFSFDLLF